VVNASDFQQPTRGFFLISFGLKRSPEKYNVFSTNIHFLCVFSNKTSVFFQTKRLIVCPFTLISTTIDLKKTPIVLKRTPKILKSCCAGCTRMRHRYRPQAQRRTFRPPGLFTFCNALGSLFIQITFLTWLERVVARKVRRGLPSRFRRRHLHRPHAGSLFKMVEAYVKSGLGNLQPCPEIAIQQRACDGKAFCRAGLLPWALFDWDLTLGRVAVERDRRASVVRKRLGVHGTQNGASHLRPSHFAASPGQLRRVAKFRRFFVKRDQRRYTRAWRQSAICFFPGPPISNLHMFCRTAADLCERSKAIRCTPPAVFPGKAAIASASRRADRVSAANRVGPTGYLEVPRNPCVTPRAAALLLESPPPAAVDMRKPCVPPG
jgi:hypothetical protein